MKFKFRLEPLLKAAERKLAANQEELSRIQAEISNLQLETDRAILSRKREDRDLSSVADRCEAGLFYHRRHSFQTMLQGMRERESEYREIEVNLGRKISRIKQEIYRLEKLRDQALRLHRQTCRRVEDQELDEISTLRSARKHSQ